MQEPILMYGSPTCPMVPTAKGILQRAGAEFLYMDITRNAANRMRVREINNGLESVPTLVFPDGSTLTEPSPLQLKQKLETLGYEVQPPTLRQSFTGNPLFALLAVGALVLATVDHNVILMVVGLGFMTFVLLKDRFD